VSPRDYPRGVTFPRSPAAAIGIDLVLIVAFAALGRSSHDEGATVGGTAETAAPFLLGYSAGALATGLHRDPLSIRRAAAAWGVGMTLGLALRNLAFGRGIALSFIIVALVTTAVLLLGWRGGVRAVRALRGGRSSARA
jgi:hypothetical protein